MNTVTGTPTNAATAAAVRDAQRRLGATPWEVRAAALSELSTLLEERQDALLAANRRDLERARADDLAGPLLKRLELSPGKLDTLRAGVEQLAAGDDPLGRVRRHTLLDDGLELTQVTCPLGVLLVIFESRPDAVVQIGSLALATGNGLLLKGGREATESNRALAGCLGNALAAVGADRALSDAGRGPAPQGYGEKATQGSGGEAPRDSGGEVPRDRRLAGAVALVEGREAVAELLELDRLIDVVIPRGSGDLVRHIQAHTRIPVLGHAEGVCHLYLDATADPAVAAKLAVDGKCDYPAACNATETLLVHRGFLPRLPAVAAALVEAGVALKADAAAREVLPGAAPASDDDFGREWGDLTLSVKVVDGLDAAVEHVHRHGSAHTEAIVTGDPAVGEEFLRRVDAASVFVNASTRFADGYRYGLGAEVGISTGRIHARGPVGAEGLLTTRWLLRGHGQAAADYGPDGRPFLHRTLP